MFGSRFKIFKWLIIGGLVWIVMLISFYFSLTPENIEEIEQRRLSGMPKNEEQIIVENLPTAEKNFTPKAKSEDSISEKTKKNKIQRIEKFGKRRDYTRMSQEILKQLDLVDPGENGKAVVLKNVTAELKAKIDEGWKNHEFNEFVSDLISIHRTLPDARDDYCKQKNLYSENLPKTSVIIIFHNEAWSTLLRSVYSVLDRSPEHLLEEIILVDDASTMAHIGKPLEDYMSQIPKVKILRAPEREGLIKARIRGTMAAKAPTLTFLDSHVECADGWLEPLLDRIAKNSTNVVCPVIDVIDDETLEFSYQGARSLQVGGFDWMLTFDWHMVPEIEQKRKKDPAEPTNSPTMAGGLFTIDAEFFRKLGMYDPDFDIWGAENLELSFKTWMCGGTLEIIPCSHVGHIFRKKSPYKWRPGVDVLKKNTVRLAEVWLDEYAKIYYLRTGSYKGEFGDISERVKLRKDLGCKSFRWYLENIYPELDVPDNFAEGYVENMSLQGMEQCLDAVVSEGNVEGKIQLYPCHFGGGNQFFEFSKNFEVKKEAHCLDYGGQKNSLQMYMCHKAKGNQEWMYNNTSNQLKHKAHEKCLGIDDISSKNLVMQACNDTKLTQKWIFEYLYEEKFVNLTE